MEAAPSDRAEVPKVQVFRAVTPRPHAAWSTATVVVYWVGLGVILEQRDTDHSGLLTLLWFVWQFPGLALLPMAGRRLDEALGARRSEPRPLYRPYLSTLWAFVGSILGAVVLAFSLDAMGYQGPVPLTTSLFVAAVVVSAYLGACGVALGIRERAVSIGYDALVYRDGRQNTTIALRDIFAVSSVPHLVEVLRRDGPPLVLKLEGTGIDQDALAISLDRAARAAQQGLPLGATLRREGRTLDAWRTSLRQRVMGGNGFRAQAVDRDDLVSALVHPGATAEERIGAALALCALDAVGATLIRVAADAAIDPALRDVLRAVVDGSVDEVLVRTATRG